MKIVDIRCYVLESPAMPQQFRWRRGLAGSGDGTLPGEPVYSAVIRVDTDAGITGSAACGNGFAAASLVRRRLKKLIGMNPLLTEQLWKEVWEIDRLEEMTMIQLGLLDLACWDIKSQAARMPLYAMLGGSSNRVPAYASTVTWDTMDEYERHIKECMGEGFRAFKLHAWGDLKEDSWLARNLRKWTGDDADLMFDGSAGWDYVTSLRFGRVLEEQNFLWFEEPMREFDLPSYTELCRSLDIPVLAAETSDGCHWNAASWIQARALDMVRTSTHYKGGLTGAIKIGHLAESFGMRAQVHGGGYGNAHPCAALPNNDYYEELVIDTNQIQGLRKLPVLPLIDGFLTVPDEPGLGPPRNWSEIESTAILTL